MKKIISAILAACTLIPITGCGKSENTTTPAQTSAVTAGDSAESETAAEAEPEYKPDLPDTDMGGKTFTILTQGWANYSPLSITDVCVDEQNGEILNDQAFIRKSTVEEKYNCLLAVDNYEDSGAGENALIKTVQSGDDVYGIAVIRGLHYTNLITKGCLMQLTDLPYLDFDAPYYDKNSLGSLKVLGRTYGIASDITTCRFLTAYCSFVNLKLMENYQLGNIYDIVRSDGWTVQKMLDMGKVHSADIDGNGKYDNQDHYAVTHIRDSFDGLSSAGGAIFGTITDDDIIVSYDSENNIRVLQRLTELFSNETLCFNCHLRSKDPNADEVGMFIAGKVLVSIGGTYYGPQFRDMEDDFAILPLPKLDESAEGYINSFAGNFTPITVVPVTCAELEHSAMILEDMAYLGHENLYPAIYENILKEKIARDPESTGMIDMIFGSTFYDAGMFYNFGSVIDQLRVNMSNHKTDFASFFAKYEKKIEKARQKLIDAVNDN